MPKINKETIIAMSLALSGISASQAQVQTQNQEPNSIYQTASSPTNTAPTYNATNTFSPNQTSTENGAYIYNLICDGRPMQNSNTQNETGIYTKIANAIEKKYGPNSYALTEMALCCNQELLKYLGLQEAAEKNPYEMNKIRDLALLKLASQETLPESIQQTLISQPNRAHIQDLAKVNGLLLENNIKKESLENIALNICNKYNQNAYRMTELAICKDSELCANMNIQYPIYTDQMLYQLSSHAPLPEQQQNKLTYATNKADKRDISQISGYLLDNLTPSDTKQISTGYYAQNYQEIASQLCGKYGKNTKALLDKVFCGDEAIMRFFKTEDSTDYISTLKTLIYGPKLPDTYINTILQNESASISDKLEIGGNLINNLAPEKQKETNALTFTLCKKYGKNANNLTKLALEGDIELAQALHINKEALSQMSKEERCYEFIHKLANSSELSPEKQEQLIKQNKNTKQATAILKQHTNNLLR